MISLRFLRAIAGLSVRQLAQAMGVTDGKVQDIEAMEIRLLDVDELVNYCTGLRMPVTISVDAHDAPGEPNGTLEILTTRKV